MDNKNSNPQSCIHKIISSQIQNKYFHFNVISRRCSYNKRTWIEIEHFGSKSGKLSIEI